MYRHLGHTDDQTRRAALAMNTNDDDWKAWAQEVIDVLIPKLQECDVMVSILPRTAADVKFAVELGLAVVMDKPILAIVEPGAHVSRKIIAVADEIIEVDLRDLRQRNGLASRIAEFSRRMQEQADPDR